MMASSVQASASAASSDSALAARAYERVAISPVRKTNSQDWDYSVVLGRLTQAGACAGSR